jgi:hypothetical protein
MVTAGKASGGVTGVRWVVRVSCRAPSRLRSQDGVVPDLPVVRIILRA